MPGALNHQPVLLLHGFGQTGQVWRPVVDLLNRRETLCPDLPGHGALDAANPITPATMIEFALDQAETLTKPILVGYSMGGRLAIQSVLAKQSSFAGLILISATAGIEADTERVNRVKHDHKLASLLENGKRDEFESIWQNLPIWDGDPSDLTANAARMRMNSATDGLARAMRGFSSGIVQPAWDRLDQIVIPTAILAGARDTKYVDEGIRMNGLIASSELVIKPDCGHSLVMESPSTIAEQIERISLRLQQAER